VGSTCVNSRSFSINKIHSTSAARITTISVILSLLYQECFLNFRAIIGVFILAGVLVVPGFAAFFAVVADAFDDVIILASGEPIARKSINHFSPPSCFLPSPVL
jgi:hypothetical protein